MYVFDGVSSNYRLFKAASENAAFDLLHLFGGSLMAANSQDNAREKPPKLIERLKHLSQARHQPVTSDATAKPKFSPEF